jgi:hypothetical protein
MFFWFLKKKLNFDSFKVLLLRLFKLNFVITKITLLCNTVIPLSSNHGRLLVAHLGQDGQLTPYGLLIVAHI